MAEVQLSFLLMGKTGEGKSETGNTMLGRKAFKSSSNTFSETKDVTSYYAKFNNYTLLVVDGPGLEDTDLDKAQDKIAAAKNMDQALGMCNGGVAAFLLVTKFGERFTKEDRDALEALKRIFGEGFMKHLIVVVTYGDLYQGAMEAENRNITFHDWCRQQRDAFLKLFQDCEGRFVLFNNREKGQEKKQAQIQEVLQLAESLEKRHGRYTSQSFAKAKRERDKMILEKEAPQLEEQFQKKICFLISEIDKLPNRPSEDDKQKIRDCAQALKLEIEKHDQGFGVLKKLKDMVKQAEEYFDDKEKLIALAEELEAIRQSKKVWDYMGQVGMLAGKVLSVDRPDIGKAVAAISEGVSGVAGMHLEAQESENKEKQEQIKRKNKW